MRVLCASVHCVCRWDICAIASSIGFNFFTMRFIPYTLPCLRPLCLVQDEVIINLPDKAVTKLYLKYRHLPSLQDHISPGVKDPQHLSQEEVERVRSWFRDHMMEVLLLSNPLPVILVEAGVTDEEVCSSTIH